jgi:hypothetical protein
MDVSHRRQWVGEGFDPCGVDSLELLDQVQNFIQVGLSLGEPLGRELQACQPCNADNFLFGKSHGVWFNPLSNAKSRQYAA